MNGKASSTRRGRGWNDEGIKAFNGHLESVYNDRYYWNGSFNKRFKEFCDKVKSNNKGEETDDAKSENSKEKVKGLSCLDLDQRNLKQMPDIAEKRAKYNFALKDDKAAEALFMV